jgi:diguanylate cyclase (GGDEF)-like protein
MQDPLTGLSTRPVFFEQVRRALASERPTGWATVVLSVDLDHFHRVNDEHGHDGGDAVLVTIANRLRTSLRQYDSLASGTSAITRLGGDEFLLMCETVRDEAAALVIARSVLETVAQPIELDAGKVALTASIGISMGASESEPQLMILHAEAAQRHAKESGGARHQFFTAEYQERSAAESALVEALQHAVTIGEFRLVYQPKISLATNRIVGVEALLRWEHPERGLLAPGDFIAAAERSGVIVPIGAWVLSESLRQAAVWQQAYPTTPLRIAVNVSARQFRTELASTIGDSVDEVGISPSTVCLEMTETMLMEDIESTIEILDELKALGLTVSIDDFGTGYSSLEYLHRMPIDEVKIDQSFVAGLGSDAVNSAIVASVVSLAHAMNLEVVAEGVETREQLERLRTLGCDFAQGYFIARPMPASEIDECLAANAAGEELPSADPTGGAARPPISETVLVVDDAADVRMLARMSLTAAGFTVEEAGNGAAAVALARRLIPECVLLDLSMPDMSGIAVCKALRNDPITAGCTIVMLTTHADPADKAEAFMVGADDYIVKPFTPRDLVARVHSALHRRQTTIGRQVDDALLEMLHTFRERELAEGSLADAEQLSSRQIEILKRLLGGERVPAIARELFLSQSTVRNHLSAIYRRLGVHSQEELLSLLRTKSGNLPPLG